MRQDALSEDEYIAAWRLFSRLTNRGRLAFTAYLATLGLLIAVTHLLSHNAEPVTAATIAIATLTGLAFVVVVFVVLKVGTVYIQTRRLRASYREDQTLHEGVQLSWNDESLTSVSALGTFRTLWTNFRHIRENEQFILIYLSRFRYFVIPKNRFESNTEQADFLSHLNHCTRK